MLYQYQKVYTHNNRLVKGDKWLANWLLFLKLL